MIISQTRIRSINRHFGFIDDGQTFILGVRDVTRFEDTLARIGFNLPPNVGEKILPSTDFGPVSKFNAEGKYIVHRDKPKETAYRTVEWTWEEWRGRYDTEERTDFVEVPYERYPRTFVSPPSIELTITQNDDGELFLVSPSIDFGSDNHDTIIHITNLYLETFGECEIFTDDLDSYQLPNVQRVNWDILPPGEYPWERLEEHVKPIIDRAKKGNRPVIKHRFSTINTYNPEFHAIGRGGFWGYVVFGFPEKRLYVFESSYTGNATYVFRDNWRELSKLTKSEILNNDLQEDRIIHRKNWPNRIHELLSD